MQPVFAESTFGGGGTVEILCLLVFLPLFPAFFCLFFSVPRYGNCVSFAGTVSVDHQHGVSVDLSTIMDGGCGRGIAARGGDSTAVCLACFAGFVELVS